MAMRSMISCNILGRFMGKNWQISSLSGGIRRFTDRTGRVLNEEERARETVYVQKMEKERLEKLKLKAEKENADKSDKKSDGDSSNR
ncbi:hypothetical protein LIER_31992 [Lithospermum erythrorhizon]|uniref:ATPase inhibitor n=1 Tax=Lithospermum erythrorhizon TaxID=34254 RepID=A0AAV3RTD7_LITER